MRLKGFDRATLKSSFGLVNEYGGVFLFSDKVVLVTGAAGGLGRRCVIF